MKIKPILNTLLMSALTMPLANLAMASDVYIESFQAYERELKNTQTALI